MPSRKSVRDSDGRLKANRPRTRPPAPKSRWDQLRDGDITVEDLDHEEIMRGRVRDKNGGFTGRPPQNMPRAIVDGLRREFHKRIDATFDEGLELALATLQDVMASRQAAAPARVRAAEVWIERTRGKVPDKLHQTIEMKPYEEDIAGLLVDVDTPDNVVPLHQGKEQTG